MNEVCRVLFFSTLRDVVGSDELAMPLARLSSPVLVGDLIEQLNADYPGLKSWEAQLLIAVNSEYASRDAVIEPGDEVALMPPVQGG